MLGVPMRSPDCDEDEPTCVYCDNKTVVRNSMRVESTLEKKHSSVAYHFTRWCVAAESLPILDRW